MGFPFFDLNRDRRNRDRDKSISNRNQTDDRVSGGINHGDRIIKGIRDIRKRTKIDGTNRTDRDDACSEDTNENQFSFIDSEKTALDTITTSRERDRNKLSL